MVHVLKALVSWLRYWLWLRPLARLRREEFYVDSRAGNDDSPGTETAPMRTLAELNRRLCSTVHQGDIVVQLESDFSEEALVVNLESREGAVIEVAGGTPEERRAHARAVKEFQDKFWSSDPKASVRARDFPEPPATVGGMSVIVPRAHAKIRSIRFLGKK